MKHLTLIDKAFLLKRTPLFSTLDLDLLLTIADKLGIVVFDANDYVFVAGEEANRMYFIIDGEVDIRLTDGQLVCHLKPGDFFGEESLFNGKPRAYGAFTPVETYVLTLSRTNLYTIISECPSVAIGFLQVYTSAMQFRPLKQAETDK
ncbi:cyclic nucleotide-binding domain-containing protein [Candidatus Protochlamydia phocaeensis]|uniref:cyclic nucleotide-binding domain-containing protein n=1 Tax=Candidatus Protochlamydia phocaeensis TaxID=1414722 RepID=UPI0008391D5F|nr:cyclic nucleotide-binding domain-containing protein [Candidatus Protochlamydia phocaeensis]